VLYLEKVGWVHIVPKQTHAQRRQSSVGVYVLIDIDTLQPQIPMSHSTYTCQDCCKLDTIWRGTDPEQYSSKMLGTRSLDPETRIAVPSSCWCWNKVWLVNGSRFTANFVAISCSLPLHEEAERQKYYFLCHLKKCQIEAIGQQWLGHRK
jgi:hypothetical protein